VSALASDLGTDLVHALDPARWAGALGFAADPWQADVLRSNAPRLLLNCSRQSGKSTVTALLALHRAIFWPDSLVLLLSPSLRQSGELYRKVRGFLGSVGADLPKPSEESALRLGLVNGSRIVSLPGTERTIRGYSAVSLLIIDEAARVDDPLYYGVRPMLAVSSGRLVALSTPWGQRGWWHDAWVNGGAEWGRVHVTAYDCPRISAAFLEEERRTIGAWHFEQEYLGIFKDAVDAVFSHEAVAAAFDSDVPPLFPRFGEDDAL
jgi:hypothetical protein